MARRGGAVHVVTTRRHYKDKVYETVLLRRSYREGGKVKTETLANLSHLPPEAIAAVRASLAGQTLVAAGEASFQAGHDALVADDHARRGLGRRRGLARRHLRPGGRVLYDLSSSWVEGSSPLSPSGATHVTAR